MFESCRKSLFYLTAIVRTSQVLLQHRHSHSPSSSTIWALNYTTAIATGTSKEHSFTVKYLINNCGFSPESALSASKYVLFRTPEKPDAVLSLFRNFGFSDSQLHITIRKVPELLLSNPATTLLPKLLFLQSKGASNSQIVCIVIGNPRFLHRSLEKHVIPAYNLINGFLQSDERTLISIKRSADLICYDNMRHNITLLLEIGVREGRIAFLLRQWPGLSAYNKDGFRKKVDEIREMGMDPSKSTFVPALCAKTLRKSSTWESKVELYKRWGWTEEAIHEAFRRHPLCFLLSERKIEACLEFFVNHLGWDPLVLASYPVLFSLSLEKRIIPRASVLQFLQSRDLIKDAKNLYAFHISEKMFLQKFVDCFNDQAPQLLKLYEEKMNLSG